MFWFSKKKPQKTGREQIMAQAKATVSAKTQEIGEGTLSEIRTALLTRENSALEQAKRKVMHMDQDKLSDNMKYWLHDKE